jgi:hypothetical protein
LQRPAAAAPSASTRQRLYLLDASAGVAQNLRRMLDRGELREEALPGGTTGYRIADGQNQPTTTGPEGATQQ